MRGGDEGAVDGDATCRYEQARGMASLSAHSRTLEEEADPFVTPSALLVAVVATGVPRFALFMGELVVVYGSDM